MADCLELKSLAQTKHLNLFVSFRKGTILASARAREFAPGKQGKSAWKDLSSGYSQLQIEYIIKYLK